MRSASPCGNGAALSPGGQDVHLAPVCVPTPHIRRCRCAPAPRDGCEQQYSLVGDPGKRRAIHVPTIQDILPLAPAGASLAVELAVVIIIGVVVAIWSIGDTTTVLASSASQRQIGSGNQPRDVRARASPLTTSFGYVVVYVVRCRNGEKRLRHLLARTPEWNDPQERQRVVRVRLWRAQITRRASQCD